MYVYNAPKAFYIVYTLIFVVMYVVKYNINSKMKICFFIKFVEQ